MSEAPDITAKAIIASADNWRRTLHPTWLLENMIVSYANGGPPPSDDDPAEEALTITPLGFAQTRMKQEVGPRLDVISMEPGIMDGFYRTPVVRDDPDRTSRLQTTVPTQINAVVQKYLKAVLTQLAGRTTVTGRGFLYRTSPNDWQLKCERMLYPAYASTNIMDSNFREWVFPGKLSLRDIDTILANNPSKDRKSGWSRNGIEQLKLWILASQAQRYNVGGTTGSPTWAQEYNPETWLGYDLETCCRGVEPIDVYWYFRKNGVVTKNDPRYGGDEEVDLYCVSRFGCDTRVAYTMQGVNQRIGNLNINYTKSWEEWLRQKDAEYRRRAGLSPEEAIKEDENERMLYCKKGLFKSIRQALIVDVSDVSVAGEQKLAEVKGAARVMMPKLAAMEGLMSAIIEGAAFGVTVNWNVRDGTDNEYLDQLSRFRNRPGQAFPEGIRPMEKNNTFQGLGQVGALIGQLDSAIASDSLMGASSTYGRSSPDFVDEAREQLSQKQGVQLRSLQQWYETLDEVVQLVGETLCRQFDEQKKTFPCYQDALKLASRLINYEGVFPDEWDADRWEFKARRISGNMTPAMVNRTYLELIQTVGPHMPQLVPYFTKQILRAKLGDPLADQLTAPAQDRQKGQQEEAMERVTNAYVTLQPPPGSPMDDPVVHSGVASQVAQARMQLAMQSGRATQQEVQGILAILAYAAMQIQRMPEGQMSIAGMQRIQEMAKAVQSIPVMDAQQEPMTDYQRASLELKANGQKRLEDVDAMKAQQAKFNQLKGLKELGLKQDMNAAMQLNMANQRAATTLEQQRKSAEFDAEQMNNELADPFI